MDAKKEDFVKNQQEDRGRGRFRPFLLMLGFITVGILKASEKGVFISEKEETYEYGGRTWVVFEDELPLSLEDLTGEAYESYTRENKKEESPFIRQEIVSQRPRLDAENFRELPELDYTLVTVKMSGLYDKCRQSMIQDGERHYPEGERGIKRRIRRSGERRSLPHP